MDFQATVMQTHSRARLLWKRWLCRQILGHLGKNAYIHPTVEFGWPRRIHLDDDCKLYGGVVLNARPEHGISIEVELGRGQRVGCVKDGSIGIRLGKGVKIHHYSYVDSYGGYVYLNDGVGIGHYCVVGGHGGLEIGKNTKVAGLTYIISSTRIYRGFGLPYLNQECEHRGITIGENVWIGAGCVILDGVTIGNNSVIGAGAVVTKSIPANSLALGVPAEIHDPEE